MEYPDVQNKLKYSDAWIAGSADAMEKLGYEVFLDFKTTFLFHRKIFYSSKVFSLVRRAYKKIFKKMDAFFLNMELKRKVVQYGADIYYTELNPVTSKKTLDFLRSKKIKTIEWFGIFPFNFAESSNQIKTVPAYDLIVSPIDILPFFNPARTPIKFKRVFLAPNLAVFKKIDLNQDEKLKYLCDVSFVGSVSKMHSNRWDVLEALSNHCKNFSFYGYGINQVPQEYSFLENHLGTPLSNEYAKIINASKISINLFLDHYEKLSAGINLRACEIPACEAFQLCKYSPNLEEIFTLGRDIETFETIEELLEKVDYYLKNDQARIRIAKNGCETIRSFTYESQVSSFLSEVV